MATFDEIVKKTRAMTNRIASYTGVPKNIVKNVIQYTKCLQNPAKPDTIDDQTFIAQMGLRFGITSKYHVQLMLEATRPPRSTIIRVEDYARMICIFLSDNLDVMVDFVFNVYNFNETGFITSADIAMLLKNAIYPMNEEDPQELLKEMIELVFTHVDTNSDGLLSLEEFREYVMKNSLCLELFGKVLPNGSVVKSLYSMMETSTQAEIKDSFAEERSRCLAEPKIPPKGTPLFKGVIIDMV